MVEEFEKSNNVVYIKCHEAAIKLSFRIMKEDIADGQIIFKVGLSWLSWGEKFKILITSLGTNLTRVEVASETAFAVQLIDWEKNDDNIRNFFKTLNELLKA